MTGGPLASARDLESGVELQNCEIRGVEPDDRAAWIELRGLLWPDEEDVATDVERYFEERRMGGLPHRVFVAATRLATEDDSLVGFAECSIREEACEDCGVRVHLEGWYVRPTWRGRGVGRGLVDAVTQFAGELGCRMLTSDTTPSYAELSVPAHRACGFEPASREECPVETEEEDVIRFRRLISKG